MDQAQSSVVNLTVLTGDIQPLPRKPSLPLHSPVLVASKVLQPRVIRCVVWGKKVLKSTLKHLFQVFHHTFLLYDEPGKKQKWTWFITSLSLGRDIGGTRIKWIANAWLWYSWLVLMLMTSQRRLAKHRIAIYMFHTGLPKWDCIFENEPLFVYKYIH